MVDEIIPPVPSDTPPAPVDPGYTNTDLHKESMKEIAANTELPKPPEDKTVQKDEEKEMDLEDVGKKIAEETAKKLLDEQESRAKAHKEQEEADKKAQELAKRTPKDEYNEIRDTFEKEQGRVPTWDELAVKIEERTLAKLEQRQKEAADLATKTQKEQQAVQEQINKQLNAHIDEELSDIYRAGKLAPIKDKNNPSDPGVMERKDFFAQWALVNQARIAAGKPEILSAARMMYGVDENKKPYYSKKSAEVPGANAPVFGNKGSSAPPSDHQEVNYLRDIKGKGWRSRFFRG